MTRSRFRTTIIGLTTAAIAGVAGVGAWMYFHPRTQPPKVAVSMGVRELQPAPLEPSPVPDRLHLPQPEQPHPATPGRRHLPLGAQLGKIEIPRLHLSATIREGTNDPQLNIGAGHVPSTAMPGAASGNVAIAAHRDRHFRPLRNVQTNDEILIETKSGTYRYFVKRTEVVSPDDVTVLRPTRDPELTLITCYPFFYRGHAPKRFIVHAEAEPNLSAKR